MASNQYNTFQQQRFQAGASQFTSPTPQQYNPFAFQQPIPAQQTPPQQQPQPQQQQQPNVSETTPGDVSQPDAAQPEAQAKPPTKRAAPQPYTQSPAGTRPLKRRGRPSKVENFVADAPTGPRPPVELQPPEPHPYHRGPYRSAEEATFNLQLHVFTNGYGVSQKRGVREKLPSGKYDPEGELIRKDFCCDKGGREFKSVSTGQRKRESTKTGCTWSASVRRLKREGDMWFLEIQVPEHNHPATPHDKMHTIPAYRRWQKENSRGIRSVIGRLARAASLPPRQITAYLRGQAPDPDLDRIDPQILRSLSMGDTETEDPQDQSTTIFEMLANRPHILLRNDEQPPLPIHFYNPPQPAQYPPPSAPYHHAAPPPPRPA